MQAIRNEGAFAAKVYILPQDIIDHTITLNVIEGHLAENGVVLEHSSSRVNSEVIRNQLVHTLKPGSKITSDKFERAIYLTNDLPGIAGTENLLFPAAKVGEAGLEVITRDEALVSGNVSYDNFGDYVTGRNRAAVTVQLNSPTGHAEQITVGGNVTEKGSAFGYIDTNLLLCPTGLSGGVSIDYLNYKTDETNNLSGTGLDASVYLRYPIIRSRLFNLNSELNYTYSNLEDENDLEKVSDRVLQIVSLKISGDMSDHLLGGGVTTFQVEGFAGDVNLDGYLPFKTDDALHANTQGSFTRITYSLTRLQHLVGNLQAYVAVNGQFASKHMDSHQSISFGGPFEFPGYHSGEIFGDEGWMFHGDLRYTIDTPPWGGELQVSLFYDYGELTTHTVEIVGGFPVAGAADTSYTLQSAGLGLSQSWENITLKGVLGWQINNDIPDSLLDDDGDSSLQGWIQLVYHF